MLVSRFTGRATLFTILFCMVAPANAQSVTLPIIEVRSSGDKEDVLDSSHQGKAIFLMQSGQLEEARREAETALSEAKKGDNKQVIASCYSVLGKVYRRQNRYPESLDCYQRALDYWQTQPKPDFIVAQILNNMGEEYKSMGALDKALGLLLEAKSKMTEDQANYCAIVENLGSVYFLKNNFVEAEKNWQVAVSAARKGYDRRSEVDSMSGLAVLYSKYGKKDEAAAMVKETIEKVTAYFGPSDQRLVNLRRLETQNNVVQANKDSSAFIMHMSAGAAANQKGDASAAEASYMAAVNESEKFGDNFEGLPIALNNLATAYGQQEKFSKAVPVYERAIRLIEKTAGSKSTKLAEPLNALAIALASQNKYAEAEPVMKRALPLLEQTLPTNSPRLEQSRQLYKFLQIKTGKLRKPPLNSGPKEWRSMLDAGSVAMQKGNFTQAVSSYKSALAIIQKSHPKSSFMATTLSLLGVAYLRAELYKQAESTLTSAIPMCEQYNPADVQAVSLLKKALAVAKSKQKSIKLLTE